MTPTAHPTPTSARGELVRAALIVVAVLVGLLLLWQTRLLVLLTMLGVLLGIATQPAVDWLEKRRVRRGVGSPLVVLGAVALVASVALWSGPTLVDQFNALRAQVPVAINKIDVYLETRHSALIDALLPVDTLAAPAGSVGATTSGRVGKIALGQVAPIRGLVFGAVTSTLALFAGFVYVLFIAIYFAIEPNVYRSGVLLLVPVGTRARASLVYDAVKATLRKWLSTQFIAMVVIGLVTTIVLLLLGVKSAIPLGILAGILEFVPTLGPLLSAIPAALLGLADSPQKALMVILAYWGIQFLENNVLIPHLMREELDLPPALTLLWQALMAIMFGILGLFVAVPLLAACFVTVRMLHVRGTVPGVHVLRGSRELKLPLEDDA